jgi:predicted oxidoreductase
MQNLRSRYGDAPDDVLCHAWVLSHPVGCFDILGTTKPERIASASKASTLRLEREDWYAVVEAARGHKIP